MRIRQVALAIPVAIGLIAAVHGPAAAQTKPSTHEKRIERGRYLVMTSGCNDCHSPKIDAEGTPDPARLLSGRPETTAPPSQGEGEIHASLDRTAWSGPWGISYAANLTPDPETGIGKRYTEAVFLKSIRSGKKPEGEPILPPMPWPVYRNMTDEDLKSIYAFLGTLKPIKNRVRVAVAVTPTRK